MKAKVKEMHEKRGDTNFDMKNSFDRMNNRFKKIQKRENKENFISKNM